MNGSNPAGLDVPAWARPLKCLKRETCPFGRILLQKLIRMIGRAPGSRRSVRTRRQFPFDDGARPACGRSAGEFSLRGSREGETVISTSSVSVCYTQDGEGSMIHLNFRTRLHI